MGRSRADGPQGTQMGRGRGDGDEIAELLLRVVTEAPEAGTNPLLTESEEVEASGKVSPPPPLHLLWHTIPELHESGIITTATTTTATTTTATTDARR